MANEFKIRKGLIVEGASGGTVVDVQGSQGQLFSVTDNLSGSIFAVSDISGVPILDVNSSGLSTFDGNLSISEFIYHTGDTGTNIQMASGQLILKNSGGKYINLHPNNIMYFDASAYQFYSGNATFAGSIITPTTITDNIVARTTVGNITFKNNSGSTIAQFSNDISATFQDQVFSAATSSGDASSTLTTKGYVDSLITGATIYRGTWQAGISATSSGATTASTTLTVSAAILDAAGNTPVLVGAVVTGAGITGTVKVATVTSSTVYELDTAIDSTATAYIFSPIHGAPDLSGVTETSGYYYICSEAGSATPNDAGTEPNTWGVGDWVIWNDDVGSGEWQKVDNSSVLSGAGTGQTVALWEGPASVTDSETLGNAPITVSGSDTTFAGKITAPKLSIQNQINTTSTNLEINYENGDGTTTAFKDFYIRDGKNAVILNIQGSSKNATFAGDVTATTFLGNSTTQTAGNNSTKIATTAYADAAAAAVPIGNYLPLSAGSGSPLTGDLWLDDNSGASPSLYLQNGSNNYWRLVNGSTGIFSLKEATSDRITILPGGNVGIGETGPATKLEVAGGILGGLPRLNTTQRHPMGHYTPGETLFEIDPTWDTGQLQSFFNSTNVAWTADADAPGGYAITITGQVGVGGAYGSGFPYIPVDNDGVYYVECYIKNVGTGQTHYMGGNEFNENFGSTGGNPGSYAYFVMLNTNPGNTWTKVTGYIGGFDASTTGKFELATKYWTPLGLFNWGAGTGTRACVISGWKIIRADSPGDRYFDGNVGIGTTSPNVPLEVHGADITTRANTTAQSVLRLVRDVTDSNYTSTKDSAVDFMLSRQQTVNNNLPYTRLDIRLAGTTDSSTPSLDVMSLLHDGHVGIGTTNPQSKLHLATTGASTLTIQNTTNSGNAALNFRDEGNNDQFQIYYALGANRSYNLVNGNGLTIYSSQSSSEIARFGNASSGYTDSYFTGNVGIGTTSPGAKLEIYGTDGSRTHFNEGLRVTRETVPTQYGMFNYNGGALNMIAVNTAGTGSVTKFMRSGNGTSLDTSMVIDTNGNVGIGTTDPQNPLHVNGSLRIGPFLTPDRDGFVFTPGGVLNTIQANNENTNFDNNQGNIHIRTINNSSATPVERITVLSTGNVGIGTSTPNAKLDVQGTQGQLFSVTDDLSGEIFAVADISGVPIMTVNSDGTSYFDGDVGIGTTSPDLQLHIKNTATGSTGIAIENTNNGQNLDIDFYSNAGSAQGRIRYEEGAGAFNISPNLGSPGAMYINWSNNVGIGTTTIDASAPKLQVSGSIMSSSSSLIAAPTAPSIVIDYHAASNAGRIMTGSATLWDKDLALVPYGGNVGIGTTSPSAALHVYDSSSGEVIFERVTGYSGLLHFGFPSGLPSIRTSGNFAIKASNTWGADFYINSSGNVGIGTTTPTSHKLDVDGSIRGTQYNLNGNVANPTSTTATIYDQASVGLTLSAHNLSIRNYDGTNMMESARFVHDKLTCAGDVIGYGSPSDIRLKENIKPIKSALDKAMQLQGVTFDWKKSDSILDIKEDIGFIAQDVQEVLPELVRENSDGMLSMRHQGITPILLEAIKELKAEIEDLKKKIK